MSIKYDVDHDRIGFLGLPLLFNTSGRDDSGLSLVQGMENDVWHAGHDGQTAA